MENINDSKNPLVSVVIPTRNRKNLLKKAIESAINQTYKNLEIIIADNASDDGTEEMCREYAAKDSRIKYFRQKTNIGLIKNCNFCYDQCTGIYVFSVCDDDWLDLDYAEKVIRFKVENPDYVAVIPTAILYNENDEIIKENHPIDIEGDVFERVDTYIRKDVFEDAVNGLWDMRVLREMKKLDGDYYMENRYGEDQVFMIKCAIAGKIKILEDTHYRKLNTGSTRDLHNTPIDSFDTKGMNYYNYFAIMSEITSRSILKDNFFKAYLNEEELLKMSDLIKKAYLNYYGLTHYYSVHGILLEVLHFMWRHPFFLFRKEFYKRIHRVGANIYHRIDIKRSVENYCARVNA